MARGKKAASRTGKARTGVGPGAANRTRAAKGAEGLAPGSDEKPPRGVKLKTVSLFTLLFALTCLGAFVAGRPPASAANVRAARGMAPEASSSTPLGHDDARSFLRSSRRERKTGAQKFQKRAGARASVSFLLADAQQKNQQPEHIRVFQDGR
jgi:hypothetical protein